jgi:hypothetical protein
VSDASLSSLLLDLRLTSIHPLVQTVELDQGERRDRTNHDNWALGCPADSALVKGEPGSFGAAIGRGHGICEYPPSSISLDLYLALT